MQNKFAVEGLLASCSYITIWVAIAALGSGFINGKLLMTEATEARVVCLLNTLYSRGSYDSYIYSYVTRSDKTSLIAIKVLS